MLSNLPAPPFHTLEAVRRYNAVSRAAEASPASRSCLLLNVQDARRARRQRQMLHLHSAHHRPS